MSTLPSIPPAGPTLGEVLMKRMLTRPPHVFVDGDLIEALGRADTGERRVAPEPEPEPEPVKRVDIRV